MLVLRNIIGNYVGTGWVACVQLITIPIYVKLLGGEQWGPLASCMMVYAVFNLLDSGMSQVLPREVSHRVATEQGARNIGNVFLTFESLYWAVALIGAALIFVVAGMIASKWLKLGNMNPTTAETSLRHLSLQFALQFPNNCYIGALSGLQKQVLLNKVQIASVTLKHATAILILNTVSNTVIAYQLSFLAWTFVETGLTSHFAWAAIGRTRRSSRWDFEEMRKIRPFLLGMAGTTVTGTATNSIDKWMLSGMVSLKQFGYYVIVSQLANSLPQVTMPIIRAVYPRITESWPRGNRLGS